MDNADAKLAWSWICPSCVTNEGEALYGRRIGIWWVDDQLFYFGNVGDYDATSRCHRIAYQDNEWEFVNLGSEIVLFADASEVENDRETSRRSHKKKKVSETSSLPATSRQSLASPTISPGDVVFNSAGTRASSRRGSNTDAGSMDRIVERRPSPLLASDNGVFRRGRNESAADSGSLAPSRVRSNRTSTAKNYH